MAYYNNQLLSFMKPTAEQAQAEAQAANLPNQLLFGGLKAPQKEERKATLNSKNTKGKIQKNTGAASKEKEPSPVLTEDVAPKTEQDIISEWVKKNTGAEAKGSNYTFSVPSAGEAENAAIAGKYMQQIAEGATPAAQTDKFNNLMLQKTFGDYLKKSSNPYAGVDLEALDRSSQALFGSEKQGLQNIKEPTIEFNNLVGAMNRIRDTGENRQKGVLDLVKTFVKPQLTSTYTISNKPQAAKGGQTSRGLATDEKYVTSAFGKVDEDYQKSATTVKTVENMLNKNTVFGTDVVLAQMARLAGDVGNIAIQEAGRYKFPTFDGTLNSFVAYLTSNPNKQATPEVVSAMKDFVATAKKSIEEKRVERLKTLNRNFGQTSTYKDLSQRLYDQNMSYRPAESATQSSPKGRLAELLKKAGGK